MLNQYRHLWFGRVALLATILAAVVVMLGAYTRLGDAGLGCPDWPGCFGHVTVPQSAGALQDVAKHFPGAVVTPAKAWKEMVHRYFAGTLGLLILGLAMVAWCRVRAYRSSQLTLTLMLMLALFFQAALGMWTVTWQLLPLVVMGHLLGGMTIASLLWFLTLASRQPRVLVTTPASSGLRIWAVLGCVVVAIQIFLGGWTTSNYASVVCQDFPYCHGHLTLALPHWHQAFDFSRPIGVNYEGGVLNSAARIAIQLAHRYGALVVLLVNLPIAIWLVARQPLVERALGGAVLLVLTIQIMLGIFNVIWVLPMAIAVAHNGVALLLLLVWVTIVFRAFFADRLRLS